MAARTGPLRSYRFCQMALDALEDLRTQVRRRGHPSASYTIILEILIRNADPNVVAGGYLKASEERQTD